MTKSRSDDPKGPYRCRIDRVTLTPFAGGYRFNMLADGVEYEVERTARQLLWLASAFIEAALETTRSGDQLLPLTPTELRMVRGMGTVDGPDG